MLDGQLGVQRCCQAGPEAIKDEKIDCETVNLCPESGTAEQRRDASARAKRVAEPPSDKDKPVTITRMTK